MELLTTGITFFQKGGIVMYVLLLCSLFVFSIGIERAMYFRRMDSGRAFARDFYLALANNKWQKAEQLADHARGALADMITSFSVFNLESGQATAITGGVGEALIATAMGLCVAIISLTVHAYFSQRIENIVTDMEQCFSMVETAAAECDGMNKEEAA